MSGPTRPSLSDGGYLPVLEPCRPESPSGHRGRRGIRVGRESGRFAPLNSLVDGGWLTRLQATELKIWVLLFRESRDGSAVVSRRTIAVRIGVSERQVSRVLKRLIGLRLVARTRRGRPGRIAAYRLFGRGSTGRRAGRSPRPGGPV